MLSRELLQLEERLTVPLLHRLLQPSLNRNKPMELQPPKPLLPINRLITALQGMGKEIAPRVVPLARILTEKRDIAGFTAALNYATGALTKSPEIELGTGEGASGVGITQKPGSVTTGAKAAAIAAREIVAREEVASSKMRTTVTTMFVRSGPTPAQLERSAEDSTPLEKRAPSPVPSPSQGLDGVNLNMAERQVAELTFVETRAVDGAADDE